MPFELAILRLFQLQDDGIGIDRRIEEGIESEFY